MEAKTGIDKSSNEMQPEPGQAELSERALGEALQTLRQEHQELNSSLSEAKEAFPAWTQELVKAIVSRLQASGSQLKDEEPLTRLALAEAQGQYECGDRNHHCNCGSRADSFLQKTAKDGFRELVDYVANPRGCPYYWIPPEKFAAGRKALIEKYGTKDEIQQFKDKSLFLESAAQRQEELGTQIDLLAARQEAAKNEANHGLSPKAAAALAKAGSVECVKTLDPDTFAYVKRRSEWGSSGGIGYFSELWIYHHGTIELRSYQWRDRYSASNDRLDLAIHELGEIRKETTASGRIAIEVELLNRSYGSRKVKVEFDPPAPECTAVVLSPEEQRKFKQAFEAAQEEILAGIQRLMPLKPTMNTRHGPGYYHAPRIKDRKLDAEQGIGAFVIEEQIDHQGEDRQMRYEVYLVTKDNPVPRAIAEDHAYDQREGNAAIGLVRVSAEVIIISGRFGLQEIRAAANK